MRSNTNWHFWHYLILEIPIGYAAADIISKKVRIFWPQKNQYSVMKMIPKDEKKVQLFTVKYKLLDL